MKIPTLSTKIMEAFRLPKDSEEEKAPRNDAIQQATKFAITTLIELCKQPTILCK